MSKHLTEPNQELARLVRATPHGMAHWAGTGPAGATCGRCTHYGYSVWTGHRKPNNCALYYSRMGVHGRRPLPETTPSCKYFESAVADRRKS